MPEVEWHIDPQEISFHLGRRRTEKEEHPPEPLEDGCPGGYQRAPMFNGLDRYYRHRTEGGGRVSNPRFDQCDDWLIQEAILYLEREEERAHANWLRADNEAMRANGG